MFGCRHRVLSHNKAKVDEYITQREIERERRREENLKEFPNAPTREMLLARKNGTDPNWINDSVPHR